MQTFIFIHDQEIVLDFINCKKFSKLSNLKYVFLGNKPVDKICELKNIIIAKNLKDNIENWPKLTSYTGWYAIWKNELITDDYINLFEYDINIKSDLESIIIKKTKSENCAEIFGYVPYNVHANECLKYSPWSKNLILSLKKNYKIDIVKYVEGLPKDKFCTMTSNHTFSKNAFRKYMNWVDPLINDIKKSRMAGHFVERSISAFYLLENIKYEILENCIFHYQFNSHNTQIISKNKIKDNYELLLKG